MKSTLFAILMSSISSLAFANASPHTHGFAKLEISVTKDTIEANLDIPTLDLMGFEGKANSTDSQKNSKTVTDLLTKDYNMFLMDETALCEVTNRSLQEVDTKGEHTHHKYKIVYKCKDITKISTLDVNLFRDLETLKEIAVHVSTNRIQKDIKLIPTESKVILEK